MTILGIILIIVGAVLLFIGKNFTRYLPPDYQNEEDGFLQLLQSMGNLLGGAGIVFLIAGFLCILLDRFH